MGDITVTAQRNDLMRTLASKKKPMQDYPDNHFYLVDTLYFSLKNTYGNKINKDIHSDNSRRISLSVGLDDKQLTYALMGAERYKVPWPILEKKDWIDRIRIFEGLGRFEEENGNPRYSLVPNAHINDLSLEEILSEVISKSTISQNIYTTNLENIKIDISINKKYVDKFTRYEGASSDFITYLVQNQKGLLTKGQIKNKYRYDKTKIYELKKHLSVEKRIIERLIDEGYITFAEVEFITKQRTLTRSDVIGIKKGTSHLEVNIYDAKCAMGLQTEFSDTENKLRETAEFMFYNFGIMPKLLIEKAYPAMPIAIELPAVNPNYAGKLTPW